MFEYKKPLILAPTVKQENDTDNLGIINIRLSPDQIEEVHTDEYSLMLFYATRLQPMKLEEINERFPHPEGKKIKIYLDRFIEVGLINQNDKNEYFTNYPNHYVNYSNFRYDEYLESRKDSKIFKLMKKFNGVKEFWKQRTYFSIDAFFTDEQSKELQGMFDEIRKKAKAFSSENMANKKIDGLKFRRLKFYDIFFPAFIACVMLLSFVSTPVFAGNDPTSVSYQPNAKPLLQNLVFQPETTIAGNDPTKRWDDGDNSGNEIGGGVDPTRRPPAQNGGFDPTAPAYSTCAVQVNNKVIHGNSADLCRAQELVETLPQCGDAKGKKCQKQMSEINFYLDKVQTLNN